MKELISELFSNLGQKLAMLLLVGTTALTTGTAVSKVVIRQTGAEQNKTQQEAIDMPDTGTDSTDTNSNAESVAVFKDDSVILTSPTPIKSKSAALSPTAIPKAAVAVAKVSAVDTTNRCLITLFSKTYDVSSLRSSHSGGDVFTCGADMTSKYQGKHGSSVSMMSRYAYDPNNPTAVSPASTGGSSNGVDDDEEDEREDKRNEDRYENEEEDD